MSIASDMSAARQLYESRRPQMFPKLSAAQIERLAVYGKRITTRAGDVLIEPGQRNVDLFVVLEGTLDASRPGADGQITTLTPGEFAGELSTLRGLSGFVRISVIEPGEVLQISGDDLRNIVQTDAEISELFMRAFILRRMGLIAGGSDVMLIGSRHSGDTLRLREFLTRNNYPFTAVDLESDPDVQELLDRFHVRADELPVVICRGDKVMRRPRNREIVECLGMNPQIDLATVRDVIVIGAGPAGLSAAVYAASEGLDVLVVESMAPGGQAGSSSRIENYLGFPTGISGQALAGRALVQSQKFGAFVHVAWQVVKLHCDRWPYGIELCDGRIVHARSVVVASGAQYRNLPLDNLQRFTGLGVYYAATHLEAKLCKDEDVIIVGGGNSAGQAAVFLAGSCRHVHIVVRAAGLAESMSRYLIRRIEENPHITLHPRTELTALEGDERLERVSWFCRETGEALTEPVGHVFLMTGAVPNTQWLQHCVLLDDRGFVRTGADLTHDELAGNRWSLQRAPFLSETSLPGVFAVGDVRSGSVKRVASAVGEGSISIQFVHRVLPELEALHTRSEPAAVGQVA
ncbi:FAD-dependent oxidoreductase [Povalibacter sp.]|uniref:FAD-dependent oxidoreductase n=1 Tax=Povalibacter sp. TaxID=1962978 RepID=UPI002F40A6F0